MPASLVKRKFFKTVKDERQIKENQTTFFLQLLAFFRSNDGNV
jgi:hypothetical protein